MWNLKYETNELIYKTKTESCTLRTDWWLLTEWVGGEMGEEVGVSRYKLLYIGWINNKVLL